MQKEIDINKELEFIEGLFADYTKSDNSPFLRYQRAMDMKKALEFMSPGGVAMELGCEVGYMTSLISPHVRKLDVIEGSASFIEEAKKLNLKNATFYNMLFEQVSKKDCYDYIFASHVIEHLIDPVETLKIMYQALRPGGRIFVIVPNAEAASRQLAVKMGLLTDIYELTPGDLRVGHRRVYDQRTICKDVESAGLKIKATQGLFFKPFADFQIDELINNGFLNDLHLDSLVKLGEDFPELCGYIFVCAEK